MPLKEGLEYQQCTLKPQVKHHTSQNVQACTYPSNPLHEVEVRGGLHTTYAYRVQCNAGI